MFPINHALIPPGVANPPVVVQNRPSYPVRLFQTCRDGTLFNNVGQCGMMGFNFGLSCTVALGGSLGGFIGIFHGMGMMKLPHWHPTPEEKESDGCSPAQFLTGAVITLPVFTGGLGAICGIGKTILTA
jgi:hypothetical protein